MDDGDRDDYTSFVQSQWTPLFRTAYLLTGDYQLAEDLLQTTLTKVYLAWPKVSRTQHPSAYVRKMLSNQAVSWWRRKASSEVSVREVTVADAVSFRDHGDTVAETHVVWEALSTLAPRQRAVIILRYYEDMSESEIADALGMSSGTVKSTASAARARLSATIGHLDESLLTNGERP